MNLVMAATVVLLSLGTSAAELPGPATVSSPPGGYIPGKVYQNGNETIEYHAGNLPIVISAPHGGRLKPSSIPDRTAAACGGRVVTSSDGNSAELALSLKNRFYEHTGKYPHVIINRLKRSKLDANRDKTLASCGNTEAEKAWDDFQGLIEYAKAQALGSAWGKGFYIDVHGMRGSETQLGFRLTKANLQESNTALNADPRYRNKSSIRTFAASSPFDFASLLRGSKAIGTQLGRDGFASTPSKQKGSPTADKRYFTGGYNTERHACRNGGNVCGLQVETPYKGVRDNAKNRKAFAKSLVQAIDQFLGHNFGFSLWSPKGEIVVDNYNPANDESKAVFEAPPDWGTYPAGPGTYLQDYRRTAGSGPAEDAATFRFRIQAAGNYSVYTRWPESPDHSSSARFQVTETIGGKVLLDENKNQQIDGGQWNLLGDLDFSTVGWAQVSVSRSPGGHGQLAADAIRVVRN